MRYPRLAASRSKPYDPTWGGIEAFTKYDLIMGHWNVARMAVWRTRAEEIALEWNRRVKCLLFFEPWSPRDWSEVYPAGIPTWELGEAERHPTKAVEAAIYRNALEGCDWWLRDQNGERFEIWAPGRYIPNFSILCPRGRAGDTRGKTLMGWMCTTLVDRLLTNETFRRACDGVQFEDGPPRGLPGGARTSWMFPEEKHPVAAYHAWQQAGIDRQPTGVKHETYYLLCRRPFNQFLGEFVGKMTAAGLIVRTNGHHQRPGDPHQPDLTRACNGCKLESYGDWGGWPHDDLSEWFGLWKTVGEQFGGADPVANTTAQILPKAVWHRERIQRFCRVGLGSTIVAGPAAAAIAWREDMTGLAYADGRGIEPPTIPEMYFSLGDAVEPHLVWQEPEMRKLLQHRRFVDGEKKRSVVVNLNKVPVAGIPAEDAAWFDGWWPGAEKIRF